MHLFILAILIVTAFNGFSTLPIHDQGSSDDLYENSNEIYEKYLRIPETADLNSSSSSSSSSLSTAEQHEVKFVDSEFEDDSLAQEENIDKPLANLIESNKQKRSAEPEKNAPEVEHAKYDHHDCAHKHDEARIKSKRNASSDSTSEESSEETQNTKQASTPSARKRRAAAEISVKTEESSEFEELVAQTLKSETYKLEDSRSVDNDNSGNDDDGNNNNKDDLKRAVDSSVEDYVQGCEVMEPDSKEANETTYN